MLRVATPPTFASAPAAPALILMYHRVDEDVNDPFRIIVHPKRFREHLRRLGGLADVVPLNELVPLGRGPRPRVAITFDDGYIDNLEQAVPELERAGAPATVFAISDLLGSPDECWWDQLEYMFRCGWEGTRAISLDLRGQNLAGELSSHLEDLHEIHSHLVVLTTAELVPLMATLREQLGTPDAPLQRRLMTDDELRRMDASDCVEVGAHTRTHPKLTTLTAEAQIHELQGSRARLEQVLGRPVPVVSYPYGAHDDTTVSAARASGFELACTTKAAPVPASCPPLRLPRFQVENWDGFDFDIQMRRWLASAA